MNDDVLNRIEKLAAAATEGPWFLHDFREASSEPSVYDIQVSFTDPDSLSVCHMANGITGTFDEALANAAFIAAARSDVPSLAAEVRRLRAENDALRSQVQAFADRIAGQAELLAKHAESDALR